MNQDPQTKKTDPKEGCAEISIFLVGVAIIAMGCLGYTIIPYGR
jgi:hypothetical protein